MKESKQDCQIIENTKCHSDIWKLPIFLKHVSFSKNFSHFEKNVKYVKFVKKKVQSSESQGCFEICQK